MNEINIRDVRSVETSSNHVVKARYLSIQGFDLDNELYFDLLMWIYDFRPRL